MKDLDILAPFLSGTAVTEFGRSALCSRKWEKNQTQFTNFKQINTYGYVNDIYRQNKIKMTGSFKCALGALVLLL